ncbi:MAG: hypothetical protein M1812_006760 [Candelaria pacifica]|nr:MAG: hypothetical protein M1812_006760 [Candelaria pacifica]
MALKKTGAKVMKGPRKELPIKPYEKSSAKSPKLAIEPAAHWQPPPASSTESRSTTSKAGESKGTLFSRLFASRNTGPSSDPSPSNPRQVPEAAAKPTLSPSSLNSFAVSQLSTGRFGTKPKTNDAALPANYKSAARRFTFAIIALPIAIVTSYVLYERLLGQERKRLVRSPPEPKPT